MPAQTYAYTGRDAAGKLHKGRLEAPSEGAVAARLRSMGMSPVAVARGRRWHRTQPRDLARQPRRQREAQGPRDHGAADGDHDLVGPVPHAHAHDPLGADGEREARARRWMRCARMSRSGLSLSLAFQRHPLVFPPLFIHLVRAGETGGFLEHSLETAAKTFEADVKLRNTIKSAMTYPGRRAGDGDGVGRRDAHLHRAGVREDVRRPRR